MSRVCVCVAAAKRRSAPGGEGLQDGRPGWLHTRSLWPDEAVLDPGPRHAALLPHAEGEAAAYQSQGALPVKRRCRRRRRGMGGGPCSPAAQHRSRMEGGRGEGPQHLPPACWPMGLPHCAHPPTHTHWPAPPPPAVVLLHTKDWFPVCVVKLSSPHRSPTPLLSPTWSELLFFLPLS